MTAKGKVNASKVSIGDRIIVRAFESNFREGTITPSATKTKEGDRIARVIGKKFGNVSNYGRRTQRWYQVETTEGTFEASPIQTMWLAPEDAAGIKRAHVEALIEDADISRQRADALTAEILADRAARELAEDLTLNSQDGKVDNMSSDKKQTAFPNDSRSPVQGEQVMTALAPAENYTGSTVVRLLEKVWARIREDRPELPEVVIITGSGLIGGSKWGHFRAEGWKLQEEGAASRKHELFLAGEALAKGANQVLQTMLHEGAHTLAKVRGEQDTSRQGRWHNATFRKMAEEMGLEHKAASADKAHGFSFVTLTAETKARYADLLAELDAEIRLTCHLPLWLGGTTEEGEDGGGEKITGKPKSTEGSSSSNAKLTCECEEPNIIRASKKVAAKMIVRCDQCESLFEER
jgi:hypothetical protein